MTNNEIKEKICDHPHCKCMQTDCTNFHYATCNAEWIALQRKQEHPPVVDETILIQHLGWDFDPVAQMQNATEKINELVDAINNLSVLLPITKPYDKGREE